jgi:hypothetical protein
MGMNIGDRVYLLPSGEVQVVGPADESEGELLGTIFQLRGEPDDAIVEIKAPEPNTQPGLSTLGVLRKQFI